MEINGEVNSWLFATALQNTPKNGISFDINDG
jgi:hypothetical protein